MCEDVMLELYYWTTAGIINTNQSNRNTISIPD